MNNEQLWTELAILKTVHALCEKGSRRITFGQIYMHLLRLRSSIPSITRCVETVDELVKEGLLVSERILDQDPDFPYTQHIIGGLTEIGLASLAGSEEDGMTRYG